MYELRQVGESSFYIDCPTKIGIFKLSESDVCLIDSGNDKEAGKKVRRILDENNWHLTAIYNTHSHADHIGGNKYLQGLTGCKIFSPGVECSFTNFPILEPSFLYGGFPPKDLRHKFLLAEVSNSGCLTEDSVPDGMDIISLPGHFLDMVGFRTRDNVVYLADCLSSKETLDKYKVSFIYDVAKYIGTLNMIKELKADMFIPAHAGATDNIYGLVQVNINSVLSVAEKIVEICKYPICFEDILQPIFNDYSLPMNFQQYALVGSTVRSYLAWLRDDGRLEVIFENGKLLWEAKNLG